MEHTMNLVPWAFEEVKSGRKDIEVRLNDEKRQKMNIGDTIIFTNTETGETLSAEIVNRYLYDSFEDLFNSFDHDRIGVPQDATADMMNEFYSEEDQKKYQALGIEIKII